MSETGFYALLLAACVAVIVGVMWISPRCTPNSLATYIASSWLIEGCQGGPRRGRF